MLHRLLVMIVYRNNLMVMLFLNPSHMEVQNRGFAGLERGLNLEK